MSMEFRALAPERFQEILAEFLEPKIHDLLKKRREGHCMRISNLDDQVMLKVCRRLRDKRGHQQVYILSEHSDSDDPVCISSTKLVELRNPAESGELRSPLLVFIPSQLRTSAEDSFGVATFEAISFDNAYSELATQLLEQVPDSLRDWVKTLLRTLSEEKWRPARDLAQVRFLLCALENGIDGETLGASLFELGLIPDFKLFEDPSVTTSRVRKNVSSVEALLHSHKSVRGRVMELKLDAPELTRGLISFFDDMDVQEPAKWTRTIALDRSCWGLSFDKWRFEGAEQTSHVSIRVLETDLPVIKGDEEDDKFSGLVGNQVLIPAERNKFNFRFEVDPIPSQVEGLGYFTIQLCSQVEGSIGKPKKVKAWKTKNSAKKASLNKLNSLDLEEGWHFVRVLPWTEDGDQLPFITDDSTEGESSLHESEPFYVLPTGSLEEVPPQRALPVEASVEHARLRLQLTAMGAERSPDSIVFANAMWEEKKRSRKTSKTEMLIAKFGRSGSVQIPMSCILRDLEESILSKPQHVSKWRLVVQLGEAEDPTPGEVVLSTSTAATSFIAARKELFDLIQSREDVATTLEAFPLWEIREEILAYAESYKELVHQLLRHAERSDGREKTEILRSLRDVLAIDSVHVVLRDFRGDYREAMMVSPTHPVRLSWLAGWSELSQKWVEEVATSTKDHIPYIRATLQEGLSASLFPLCMPSGDGRVFMPVENISPFWSLHAPTTEGNPRGLLSEVSAALGVPAQGTIGTGIHGDVVAAKFERYLAQHPYVRELILNVFNPGAAHILASALVSLQQKNEYRDLRYDIRLFAEDPDSPVLGEALEELVRPDSVVNEAADAFAISSGNHLFSKLRIAKHAGSDFHKMPKDFPAHITMMLDVFPAEGFSIDKAKEGPPCAYGLAQEFHTVFSDDDSGATWKKQPLVSSAPADEAYPLSSILLTDLVKEYCFAVSAVASSGSDFRSVPVTTLQLSPEQRELIYEVHQVSDWVFTVDRNLGIEFFDHGGRQDRPEYLIDYVPTSGAQTTHNLIISSRSNMELEALLRPVLKNFELRADRRQAAEILANLRSLSGQLALKLVSAQTQQAEALGLALARLYLEYQGALQDQIIVPLDAHTDLYRGSERGEAGTEEVSLQRTDLALFDLDTEAGTITCNLVEVKCYTAVGDIGAYNQLKKSIAEQIRQSEKILQRHFDPSLKSPDRPDRCVKNQELRTLLRFYLERSQRYGIIEWSAADECADFLERLDDGYSLHFRRAGLVFDFDKTGTESPESETGIEYHRIGKDLVQMLLDSCSEARTATEGDLSKAYTASEIDITGVPKLATAEFLAPKRSRTKTKPNVTADSQTEKTQPSETEEEEPPKKPKEEPQPPPAIVYPTNHSIEGSEKDKRKVADLDEKLDPSSPVDSTGNETPETSGSSKTQGELDCEFTLGVTEPSPQFGVLGEWKSRKVALDLNQTHTISLFGVQGGGKSYTLGSVIEMATMPIPHINQLPSPLATVIFHYSSTEDYAPEFTSMVGANAEEEELRILRETYGAEPKSLKDVLILTPKSKVAERKIQFPDVDVESIAFSASELKAAHWKFLMGAVGSQSMYLRQVNMVMRGLRNNLTLDSQRQGIQESSLSDHLKGLAELRLGFAGEYIDDSQILREKVRPGRLIIVDLRDEYIEKDEALGLFVVMLQIFSEATHQGKAFNKLVVFDEAHKYIENEDLVAGLVEVVREMRHKGTSIMVASQDPPSVPLALVELSTQIIMHKFNSPAWLKHIQKVNAALRELTAPKMSSLGTGEAYVWSSKATDDAFTHQAQRIRCRPRVTQHGGATKTAL